MTASKQLTHNVTVHKAGVAYNFAPGDELPDWALDQLLGENGNPDVFEPVDDDDDAPKAKRGAKKSTEDE